MMALSDSVNQLLAATPEAIQSEIDRLNTDIEERRQAIGILTKLLPGQAKPKKPKGEASKGLDHDVKDQIAELYETGADIREIAESLNLPPGKVKQSINGMKNFGRLKPHATD